MTAPDEVKYTMDSRLGEARLLESIYRPVVELMSDYQVRTFAEMLAALTQKSDSFNRGNLLEAILTLSSNGTLSPAIKPETIAPEVKARCLKFNHALLESAHIPQLKFLASPVLQGALNLSDIFKVLIQMYLKDPKISRKEMCHQICDLALGEGKTLNKDGKPITKRKEQEAVLAEQVDLFREHTLQLMSALAVI